MWARDPNRLTRKTTPLSVHLAQVVQKLDSVLHHWYNGRLEQTSGRLRFFLSRCPILDFRSHYQQSVADFFFFKLFWLR